MALIQNWTVNSVWRTSGSNVFRFSERRDKYDGAIDLNGSQNIRGLFLIRAVLFVFGSEIKIKSKIDQILRGLFDKGTVSVRSQVGTQLNLKKN